MQRGNQRTGLARRNLHPPPTPCEQPAPSCSHQCHPCPAGCCRSGAMSRLIKAITDMVENYQGKAKKGKKSEPFSRSEFKKLIQQEFAPVKRSPTSRYRYISSLPDSDSEPMNKKKKSSAKPCVY